jgi:hypothetical protein
MVEAATAVDSPRVRYPRLHNLVEVECCGDHQTQGSPLRANPGLWFGIPLGFKIQPEQLPFLKDLNSYILSRVSTQAAARGGGSASRGRRCLTDGLAAMGDAALIQPFHRVTAGAACLVEIYVEHGRGIPSRSRIARLRMRGRHGGTRRGGLLKSWKSTCDFPLLVPVAGNGSHA